MRVLLVDDHEVVRRGLRDLLGDERDIDVVAEAGTVAEALVVAARAKPDVAVVDMRLPDAVTERERAVLELIGEGMSNREIAERLFLAEKTVKNYVTSVLAKLGLQRRTQAVALVARRSRT